VDLAGTTPNPLINTGGITSTESAVLVIVVLSVAITATLAAHRSNISRVLTAVIIVAAGAMVAGIAAGGLITALGTAMVHLLLKI
jgi:hypothetical protein